MSIALNSDKQFVLHRLRNKFLELILVTLDDCILVNKSTSTRAHYVDCERHEVQSRRSRDSNSRPSDPWSDTLPLDHASSTLAVALAFLLT